MAAECKILYLTVEEVSKIFSVHAGTVYTWVKSGKLPGVKTPLGGRLLFDINVVREMIGDPETASSLLKEFE